VRPNIVLILADDLGYGDLGGYNGGLSQTPALDALATEGLCLSQHYSASPVCAPARASLLTGRYPHRTGAIDTLEMRGLDRLALRETTIADLVRRAGYATGLVGKWHNGALDARYHPNRRGFDEFAGFSGGWQPYFNWRLDRNGTETRTDGRYLTDVFTDEAVDFIRRHAREPFFLYLAYSAPHFPFEAPEEDVRPFASTGGASSMRSST
jgi:arylsulfatase A